MSEEHPIDSTVDFVPRLITGPEEGESVLPCEPLTLVEVATGRRWFVESEALVGRHSSCTIHLRGPDVSRRHARVRWRAGEWWISDCHSLNGLYVNGRKITEAPLRNGDEIQIGEQLLRVNSPVLPSDLGHAVLQSIASALAQVEGSSMHRRAS
jgi:predicted component of type VI protein secretion system